MLRHAKNIKSLFLEILKIAPFSATITILYFILKALFPAFTAFVFAGLFSTANAVLNGIIGHEKLIFWLVLYLSVRLVLDILNYLFSVCVNTGVFEKSTMKFKIMLYKKTACMPLLLFENIKFLEKKQLAEQAVNDEILPMVFYELLEITEAAITAISVAIILSQYNICLLPLSILSVLPFLISRIIRGKEFYTIKNAQVKSKRKLSYLWSLFSSKESTKEMRVMGFENYITDKWKNTFMDTQKEVWNIEKKDALSLMLCNLLSILGYGLSIALVLYLSIKGKIDIGVFGASITAFASMQKASKNFLIYVGQMPEKLGYVNNYFSFIDMQNEVNGYDNFSNLTDKIELKNINFKYPNAQNKAIKNVTFEIKKGEKIAIVGENGSGKTTLSKLIIGMYKPDNGKILYDNQNLNSLDKKKLYKNVSLVSQDFVRYLLTVRENVAISDVKRMRNDNDIKSALNYTNANNLGELDMPLGREFGGNELSGGQWQKLAIARGLFKKSEIIVLDEPTSSLDPLFEYDVLSRFIDIAKNKTAIMISHRIGLCKLVDKIVVMKNGKIVEVGNHENLISQNGEYTHLYKSQQSWYQN